SLTPEEREGLLRYAPGLDIDVVPHGVDTEKFSPVSPGEQEMSVAFLGNYPHDPNLPLLFPLAQDLPHLYFHRLFCNYTQELKQPIIPGLKVEI
ncbi:unnamed protein product, partial [marine sediment metagenome]